MTQILYIHNIYLRELQSFISLSKLHKSILIGTCIEITLYARCRGAKKRLCSIHLSQDNRRRTSMVARGRLLLFETRFMFLVYDNQTEILKRKKYGTSRTKYHIIRIIRHLFLPYLHTFSIAILRMINAQLVSKDTAQAICYLNGEGYFRQQVENLLMLQYCLTDEMYVYFSFSTGCNAMKEHYILLHKLKLYLIECILLFIVKRMFCFRGNMVTIIEPPYLFLIFHDKFAVYEGFYRCRGAFRHIHKLFPGYFFTLRR